MCELCVHCPVQTSRNHSAYSCLEVPSMETPGIVIHLVDITSSRPLVVPHNHDIVCRVTIRFLSCRHRHTIYQLPVGGPDHLRQLCEAHARPALNTTHPAPAALSNERKPEPVQQCILKECHAPTCIPTPADLVNFLDNLPVPDCNSPNGYAEDMLSTAVRYARSTVTVDTSRSNAL